MSRDRGAQDGRFRLLYVCTGNICRSPFAEILTRHLLLGRLGGRAADAFEIGSAGVQALVGSQMHPDTRDELTPWGLDGHPAGRFAARQLQAPMIEQAHLVLGANPRHRTAVVERAPSALSSAFGLREFARLARTVDAAGLPSHPAARAHALVDAVRARRGTVPPVSPGDDRIPDPMGRPPAAHREAAILIAEAVGAFVDMVAPSRVGTAAPEPDVRDCG